MITVYTSSRAFYYYHWHSGNTWNARGLDLHCSGLAVFGQALTQSMSNFSLHHITQQEGYSEKSSIINNNEFNIGPGYSFSYIDKIFDSSLILGKNCIPICRGSTLLPALNDPLHSPPQNPWSFMFHLSLELCFNLKSVL